jgi:putative polyhydroxyalkanoate system protein
MADIEVSRVHGLGLAGAREAADHMMASLEQRFGLRGAWDGNVLRFQRPGVTGHLAIDEGRLHLVVTLGFLLRAMRGSIQAEVLRELDRLFGDPTPSERA